LRPYCIVSCSAWSAAGATADRGVEEEGIKVIILNV
jgi:hypothetical protein